MNKKIKKGVSIAELLLVVAICAVIAIVTTTSVVHNIEVASLRSSWKKVYRDIDAATKNIKYDTSRSGFSLLNVFSNATVMRNLYAAELNQIRSCDVADTEGCWHVDNQWKSIDGTLLTSNSPGLILNNKMLMIFLNTSTTCAGGTQNVCGEIYIDVNGFKQPNTLGKDIYFASITQRLNASIVFLNSNNSCETETGTTAGIGCSGKYLKE
ncbi:MAG: hypothetical protein ACD_20C00317G0004 [uncultured bacterium]|nr:MAG: hypothetical protein ACD_20C00317G0004 [uncultured bacterium]